MATVGGLRQYRLSFSFFSARGGWWESKRDQGPRQPGHRWRDHRQGDFLMELGKGHFVQCTVHCTSVQLYTMSMQGGHWVHIMDHLWTTFKISLRLLYFAKFLEFSFQLNYSKDLFRRSKNSWKNKNWLIFGHSVRVWSIFSKTSLAALRKSVGGFQKKQNN